MFLKCSTNNEALTVLTLLEDAIQKFNVPARIRCDHGTENIQVAKRILTRYGSSVKCITRGSNASGVMLVILLFHITNAYSILRKSSFYLTP